VKAPELVHWSRPGLARHASANRAIVFVHGIFSDHNTFEACYDTFVEDVRFNDFEFFYYDYDYNDSLENNGKLLAKILTKRFGPDDQVVIIAHSMGGLVARIAIVSERMLFVRCLFLLGTPNVGAIRMAQVSLLAQLVLGTLQVAFAVFPRKEGIVDLTRAGEILESYRDKSNYADHVDYVSIPGLYFHEGRSYWELGRDVATKVFALLQLGLTVLAVYFPRFAIRLSMPHDGIVEMASNNLVPCVVGRESEKKDSINFSTTSPTTYAHVEPHSCRRLTHIRIHSDRDVIETIAEILLTQPSSTRSRLVMWYEGLSGPRKGRITRVQFRP
jgi:pimeloyl-ACP methyl ester carboxylesterase